LISLTQYFIIRNINEKGEDNMAEVQQKLGGDIDSNYQKKDHYIINFTDNVTLEKYESKENKKEKSKEAITQSDCLKSLNKQDKGKIKANQSEINLLNDHLDYRLEEDLQALIDIQKAPLRHLVFSGGGAKGILYQGMARAFKEFDILKNVDSLAGASAGSMIAAFLACGIEITEMEALMNEQNGDKIFGEGSYLGYIWKALTQQKEVYVFDGKPIEALISKGVKLAIEEYFKNTAAKFIGILEKSAAATITDSDDEEISRLLPEKFRIDLVPNKAEKKIICTILLKIILQNIYLNDNTSKTTAKDKTREDVLRVAREKYKNNYDDELAVLKKNLDEIYKSDDEGYAENTIYGLKKSIEPLGKILKKCKGSNDAKAQPIDKEITFGDLKILHELFPAKFKNLVVAVAEKETTNIRYISSDENFSLYSRADEQSNIREENNRLKLHEEDLKIPISVACRASASLPVILKPVQIGDKVYIDGGYYDGKPKSHIKNLIENLKEKEKEKEKDKNIAAKTLAAKTLIIGFGEPDCREYRALWGTPKEKDFRQGSWFGNFLFDKIIKKFAGIKGDRIHSKEETIGANDIKNTFAQRTLMLNSGDIDLVDTKGAYSNMEVIKLQGYFDTLRFFQNYKPEVVKLTPVKASNIEYADFFFKVLRKYQSNHSVKEFRNDIAKLPGGLEIIKFADPDSKIYKDLNPKQLGDAFLSSVRQNVKGVNFLELEKAIDAVLNDNSIDKNAVKRLYPDQFKWRGSKQSIVNPLAYSRGISV